MSPISPFFFFRNSPMTVQFVRISENGPDHVQIRGRKAGAAAYLFAQMGLDLTMSLEITESRIELITSSFGGRTHEIIPLTALSSIGIGHTKPAPILILALFMFPFGCAMLFQSPAAAVFSFVSAIILFFLFLFQKKQFLYFTAENGCTEALTFYRGFFEPANISEADTCQIINILTALMENARSVSAQSSRPHRTAVQDPFASRPSFPQNETPALGIKTGPHPLAPPSGLPMPPDLPKFPTYPQTTQTQPPGGHDIPEH